jgi:hypothetical protein
MYRATTGSDSVVVIVRDVLGNTTIESTGSFTWNDVVLALSGNSKEL